MRLFAAERDLSDVANDESAVVLVLANAIGIQLAQVAEVAHGEAGMTDGEIKEQLLSQAEGVARVGAAQVVVEVTTVEDVVVALSILGHEGETQKG